MTIVNGCESGGCLYNKDGKCSRRYINLYEDDADSFNPDYGERPTGPRCAFFKFSKRHFLQAIGEPLDGFVADRLRNL